MTQVDFTIEELIDLLPNPHAVDYQHDITALDLYTDEEIIKYARRLIDAVNSKLPNTVTLVISEV